MEPAFCKMLCTAVVTLTSSVTSMAIISTPGMGRAVCGLRAVAKDAGTALGKELGDFPSKAGKRLQ